MSRRRIGAASSSLLLAAALVAACGDDAGDTASGAGGSGSSTDASGTGGATSGGGGGGSEAVGEALVALLSVEDELFEIDIEGDPFALLALGEGSGVVFAAPIFDCGVGLGSCVEVFREGFTEPTQLAVEDGGMVVHFFAGDAGEEGDVTTDEPVPDPGLGETAVVVRDFLDGAQLTLSAPSGTLNPLDTGVTLVDADQEIVLVLPDSSILETGLVLAEGTSYALTADEGASSDFLVLACPLAADAQCLSWAYSGG